MTGKQEKVVVFYSKSISVYCYFLLASKKTPLDFLHCLKLYSVFLSKHILRFGKLLKFKFHISFCSNVIIKARPWTPLLTRSTTAQLYYPKRQIHLLNTIDTTMNISPLCISYINNVYFQCLTVAKCILMC